MIKQFINIITDEPTCRSYGFRELLRNADRQRSQRNRIITGFLSEVSISGGSSRRRIPL